MRRSIAPFVFLGLLLGCGAPTALPDAGFVAVGPSFIDTHAGGTLAFEVTGFVPQVSIDFDEPIRSRVTSRAVHAALIDGETRVELIGAFMTDSTHVTATVPPDTALGLYDVSVTTPRDDTFMLAQQVEVLDCALLDCSVLCTGGEKRFRDLDGDGVGRGFAQPLCGRGWVVDTGDCDDSDVLTTPGKPEVCNALDDDCNGVIDDGACIDAKWSVETALTTDALVDLSSGQACGGSSVLDVSTSPARLISCPSSLHEIAVDGAGRIEVSSDTTISSPSGSACINPRPLERALVAMVGLRDELFGVAANGQLYRWSWGATPERFGTTNLGAEATVTAMHGLSRTSMVAVGWVQSGNFRRATIWNMQPDGSWRVQPLSDLPGRLMSIDVISETEAYTGGDEGLVLRRNANGWNGVPNAGAATITAVRGFSFGRIYAADSEGHVRRFVNAQWETLFDAPGPLSDLDGPSEDALTAVGPNGLLVRGP